MNDVNYELAKYVKEKEGLKRLMQKLKDKYITLSRCSGTITIDNITLNESIDISNLLGKKIIVGTNLKTSFKEIEKKINEGKYSGFNWIIFLNNYFDNNILTKAEKQFNDKQEEDKYFKSLFEINKDRKYVNKVIELITQDEIISKLIKQKYHANKNKLFDEINNILLLLDNIPSSPTSLAVYSSMTGNPHYLDLNKNSSTLFYKILSKIKNIEYDDRNEVKITILSEINVYTDPISNFVITYKLIGNNILEELNRNNEVVNLNLMNINKISKLDTDNKTVYVFENPSLLTSLMDLKVPIIITSGMPNVSLYMVLKKLEESNTDIYYNGDFDPEGLLIADKIKLKFPSIKLFCYSIDDYLNVKSKEKISDSRLKKLDNINSKDLFNIKELLLNEKLAGYQEQNLNSIREFILRNGDYKS